MIRIVRMGPWTHKVDRTTVSKHGRLYETMYTLVRLPDLQMLAGSHDSAHSQLDPCLPSSTSTSSLVGSSDLAFPALSGCTCSCGSATGRGDSPTREDYEGHGHHSRHEHIEFLYRPRLDPALTCFVSTSTQPAIESPAVNVKKSYEVA